MKVIHFLSAGVLPLAITFGCKDASTSKSPDDRPRPKPSQLFPMPNPDVQPRYPRTGDYDASTPSELPGIDLPPNQAELDFQAAEEISEQNADEQFEMLKEELEGEGW